MKNIPLTEDILQEDIRVYASEPGDGTRYRIVIVGPCDFLSLGVLGSVHGGYLITESLHGNSYLFGDAGILHWTYVAEHLKLTNLRTATVITEMIGTALGRPYALPEIAQEVSL